MSCCPGPEVLRRLNWLLHRSIADVLGLSLLVNKKNGDSTGEEMNYQEPLVKKDLSHIRLRLSHPSHHTKMATLLGTRIEIA